MKDGEEDIIFHIQQLNFKTKSLITGLTTSVDKGQVNYDSTLTCFLNLKYG